MSPNTQRTMGVLFLLSLAIVSWAPIKRGYYPWPGSVVRVAIAYGILSFVGFFSSEFAVLLGAGFLSAQLVKAASGTASIPDFIYQDMLGGTGPGGSPTAFRLYGLRFDGHIGGE